MHICLNMIVRNERANILRCLRSVAPHISYWVICDTGSTDNTQELILQFMKECSIPGELHEFEFRDFSQARNTALDLAWPSDHDYILLMDADMELQGAVGSFDALTDPCYRIEQRGGGLTYWNTRLIRRGHHANYEGVTHEVLHTAVEPTNFLTMWFKDHMDGGSRGDKFERDARLLRQSIGDDLASGSPANPRSLYYLAQTMKDMGQNAAAIELYQDRARMGGWDEEAWHATLMAGRLLLDNGGDDLGVAKLLEAYAMRPTRAEPLLTLATHYRMQGRNEIAVMFATQGMSIPVPADDLLFIEEPAYYTGFKQELSIAAFYSDAYRDTGHAFCEALATGAGKIDWSIRNQARWNLQFYAKPLAEVAPSFKPVSLHCPAGLMNPSVVLTNNGKLFTTIRDVNYTIEPDGSYTLPPGVTSIRTTNYLAELDGDLTTKRIGQILPPADYPEPLCKEVLGFEDIRLYTVADNDYLHFIATVRDIRSSGLAVPVAGVLVPQFYANDDDGVTMRMANWRTLARTANPGHEKNWMPVNGHPDPYHIGATHGGDFVYSCSPTIVLDPYAAELCSAESPGAFDHWRGSSQLIHWMDGWLAVVHEVSHMPGPGEKSYQHRFVEFDPAFRIRRWSAPFYLQRRGIEFVAGLCWHPNCNDLVISWGANRDSEAWVGTISDDDVSDLLMYK